MSVQTIGYDKIQELVMQVPIEKLPFLYNILIKVIKNDVTQNSLQDQLVLLPIAKRDEEKSFNIVKRTPSPSIAGKAKIKGDIVNPIVDEEDWECLK